MDAPEAVVDPQLAGDPQLQIDPQLPNVSQSTNNPPLTMHSEQRIIMSPQDESVTIVECDSDHQFDWVEGQENWLVTYNLDRCVAIAIISTISACLIHVDITKPDSVEYASVGFCEWWKQEKEKFDDSRLFIIRPLNPYDDDDAWHAGWLEEAVSGATGKLTRVVEAQAVVIEGATAIEIYHDSSVPGSKSSHA
jgi:hypothetical protein